jgi:CRISPR-associated endonuclease/helicase Cas3
MQKNQDQWPSYLRYWGKAMPGVDEAPCHLLAWHCLDVAAVASEILERDDRLRRSLADRIGMSGAGLKRWFPYMMSLHDIGKFARAFQGVAEPACAGLVDPDPRMSYGRPRHDGLGALLWQRDFKKRLRKTGLPFLAPTEVDRDFHSVMQPWLEVTFGHHGQPVAFTGDPLATWFHGDDREAAWAFTQDAAELFEPPWGELPLELNALREASWTLAGLAVVADWLGSDASVFRYVDRPMSMSSYWDQLARTRAREAVDASGLAASKSAVDFPGFRQEWGFDPTPMQSRAESMPLAEGPQLVMLEDLTGSGKTEAALALTQRLLAAGYGEGLYFALPTMATSNAMYQRLRLVWSRLFTDDSRPSLVLAHGSRHLNPDFIASLMPAQPEDAGYGPQEISGSAQCNAWIADSRKRAMLADLGVGTVDQALLGILPRRHQSLRLLGLASKVLVMDEIHAYDAYTGHLLERLLESHSRQGGSAVLLTATLPIEQRRRLVAAWQRGRSQTDKESPAETAFPLLTHVSDEQINEIPVESMRGSGRRLPVDFLNHPDQAIAQIRDIICRGQCVCWIRNTVDDAIEACQKLIAAGVSADSITLFHARFTMADRQRIEEEVMARFGKGSSAGQRNGQVLIATQVVEQSLDVDFDAMISDLAPIDLLIQRAGRLHRHPRDAEGDRVLALDQRPPPRMKVLAPSWCERPDEHWVRHLLPGTAAVYDDIVCLWRTVRVLREFGGIDLPARSRDLIEGVYSPELDDLPDTLEDAALAVEGRKRGGTGMARFNSIKLEKGYSLDSADGWSDDEEIGTRLTDEPSVRVVLVRRLEGGRLIPWHDDVSHPWEMSAINLRQGLADRLAKLPSDLHDEGENLKRRHRVLTYASLWLPEEDSSANYSQDNGVMITSCNDDGLGISKEE